MKIFNDPNLECLANVHAGEVFKTESGYYIRVYPLPTMSNNTLYAVNLETGLLEHMDDYEKVEPLPDAGLKL